MKSWPIRIAWVVIRTTYRVIGVRTEGARAIAFDESGRLLLVRSAYGQRERWQFPGGGINRDEHPADAAIRETLEETGCVLSDVEAVGVFARRDGRWRDTVHVYRGIVSGKPEADGREIAEAAFFAMDALPPITRATWRRLEELAGEREIADEW